jgi:phosphoglycolate phosphatase
MKPAKYIAFDWNGTLLDDMDAVVAAVNAFLAAVKRPAIDLATFHAAYTLPLTQLYRNLGVSEAELERLHDNYNIFHDHYETRAANANLRAGATEILTHARGNGIGTVIFSNHIVDPIRIQLKRLGIDAHFPEVIAFESRALQFQGLTKGERLKNYLTERKADPKNVIIIGDSVEEIEIGRMQGLASVALTGGTVSEARLKTAKPDHLIHSLHELKPILEERGFA